MKARVFGTTGRRVAAVGQGSWRADETDRTRAVTALRRGLDLGMTHIDTAEMYGSGAAETLVAAAIEGRRDEVFLVSKVLPSNASKRGTISACEKSLARLRTDRLDCYLLHWRGSHPLEETVAAFESLVADGKILSWGVSNFDVDDLKEVAATAGHGHPACNQVLYHLQERYVEQAVIPWCAANGTAVVGYTPFGEDPSLFLPTRAPYSKPDGASGGTPDRVSSRTPDRASSRNPNRQSGPHRNGSPGDVLRDIATAHGATPRQIALAFLLRHPNVFLIPKATDPGHVADNAAAASLALPEQDVAALDIAFSPGRPRRGLPMI